MSTALDQISSWLAKQGVATILLFGILWGIWDATPKLLSQVEAGYAHNAQVLSTVTAAMKELSDKQRMQEEEMHSDFRRFLDETREIHRQQMELLQEIREAVKLRQRNE